VLDIAAAIEEIIRSQATGEQTPVPPEGSDAVSRLVASILEDAKDNAEALPAMIRTALNETTRRLNHVSLAVTGMAWLGSGVPSVDQEMISLVRGARHEIMLCAYAITTGGMAFLREMRDVAAQGVMTTVIVNEFVRHPPDVQSYLMDAIRTVPQHWKVLDFVPPCAQSELHAKVLVVDRAAALVGSANVSFRGMFSNHEMGVVVRGPLAEAVAARLEMLAHSSAARAVNL
jgi:phosphatidylserine/phosphatidylglycerophosphate/cardiolipin synthase-like enzyme